MSEKKLKYVGARLEESKAEEFVELCKIHSINVSDLIRKFVAYKTKELKEKQVRYE